MPLTFLRLAQQQVGLNYICATAERFFAVGAVLGNMVVMLAEQPSPRLLKHIIRCYLRLSDNPRCGAPAAVLLQPPGLSMSCCQPSSACLAHCFLLSALHNYTAYLTHNPRAREALRQCLPELLRNPGFTACLKSDDTTRRWLAQLLVNVGFPEAAAQLSNEMLQPTPLQGQ